jgi:hypothetical protein
VTDLSRPGWLATQENIDALIRQMSQLQLVPGFSVVFDLLGNASHRYEQFDGTQALPSKENGHYHMPGPVVTCDVEIFRRIIKSLGPVMVSAQDAVKVSVPPLPRYIFSACCNNPHHCTNLSQDGTAEKIVNGVSNLRNVLKKECKNLNVKNHWILDGIGALAGVPVGQTAGSNRDLIPELKDSLAADGVHLTVCGYRKLAVSIVKSIEGIRSGTLTKSFVQANAGRSAGAVRNFFWRGFSSPIGDAAGRSGTKHQSQNTKSGWQQRHQRSYQPYPKKKPS